MPPPIKVDGLSKAFGRNAILENVACEVNEGEVYGLVGLNGAGKTTFIRLLLGICAADSGTISVLGRDPWSHHAALYRRIGVVLEHDGFWGNLTFEQNLRIFAAAKGVPWPDTERYLYESWNATTLFSATKQVKFFSRGQRMQCALCRAFLGDPALFLFDEPAVALDVEAYEHFQGLVKKAASRGASFIISSHQLDAIDDLCDRVGVVRDRRINELSKEKMGGPGRCWWEIAATEDPRWGTIIREVCGGQAACENGWWRFSVTSPRETVPVLVTKLAAAGCPIQTVRAVENGFSESIKYEYRSKRSAGV